MQFRRFDLDIEAPAAEWASVVVTSAPWSEMGAHGGSESKPFRVLAVAATWLAFAGACSEGLTSSRSANPEASEVRSPLEFARAIRRIADQRDLSDITTLEREFRVTVEPLPEFATPPPRVRIVVASILLY
jgi:hypothetical protein